MDLWDGTFEMVNPRVIVVDHAYQRPEKPELIALIAGNVNWEAFGCLICFKRANSMFYCIDGQQRLAGVLASQGPPIMQVPALWYLSRGLEHEAQVFNVVNEYRKALNQLEKYKARIVSKDPAYLQLAKAVKEAGFTIGGTGSGPRTISSVASLRHTYLLLGEDGVLTVLSLIRDAWPDDKAALSTKILKGVAEIVAEKNGDFDRKKLIASLARVSPSQVLRKADELAFDIGGSKQVNVRRAFKALAKI